MNAHTSRFSRFCFGLIGAAALVLLCGQGAVSYTHLDVYKRQPVYGFFFSNVPPLAALTHSPAINIRSFRTFSPFGPVSGRSTVLFTSIRTRDSAPSCTAGVPPALRLYSRRRACKRFRFLSAPSCAKLWREIPSASAAKARANALTRSNSLPEQN